MKLRIASTIVLSHIISFAFAQQTVFSSYAVNNIPADLKKDANAVYRLDEGILDISSPSTYTLKEHQVISILNAEGATHLQQSFGLDKFNKIDDIEITVYNSLGIAVQKYRKKDFMVQSYYDGISLVSDDKIMHLSVAAPEYPCTVDVQCTKKVSGYINLPGGIVDNHSCAVEQFRYVVKVPVDMDIRQRTSNIQMLPAIEVIGKQKVYTWEAKNVAAQKIEADGYDPRVYLPQIEIAPNVFEYDGYKGNFTNWNDFGKWNYSLYEEKNSFSKQRTDDIKSLVNGLSDVQSKVKVLYAYLQKNMRYVSIQLGIGGFKPFAVRFVDEKKYGDCKALTNYMRSLLAVADIKSYPALITAGYNKVSADPLFPKSVFNHVILCVPNGKDSIWLECTSNSTDAGFLGDFTENKNALLLTENGGILVHTPKSNYNNNLLCTTTDILLNEEGGATVSSNIKCTGDFYGLLNEINKADEDRQSELFVQYLHYKQPDKFELSKQNDIAGSHQLNLKTAYTGLFDFKAGNKFFFPLSVNELCSEKLNTEEQRRSPYIFRFPYKKVDTTVFHLPVRFKVDNLPKAKELKTALVSYKREISFDQSTRTIKIVTTLLLRQNIISPPDYKGIAVALSEIEKAQEDKVILAFEP